LKHSSSESICLMISLSLRVSRNSERWVLGKKRMCFLVLR
jgi:hypothetical protein